MKKMIIIWLFIACCLVGTLYYIGVNVEKDAKPYRALEDDLKEAAYTYIEVNDESIAVGEELVISTDDLEETDFLPNMEVNEDECSGYVLVSRTYNDYEYKAYIKCNEYTSVDYDEKVLTN